MQLIERDQCLRDLNNFLLRTPDAFHVAMRRMRSAPPEDLLDRTPRSGSNLTRDYAVAEIEKLWSGNPNVRVHEKGMRKLFIINEKYAIRIKKFDHRARSRNVKTRDDYRFRFQLPIAGIPRLIHLELGYQPNILRTSVADVKLVCLNGHKIYWSYSIENPDDNDNVYDLFQNTPDPNGPRPKPVPREIEIAEPKVKIRPKKR